MKPDYTHITLILDRSGSMERMRSDAIGGFNTFLTDQKTAPGSATLTLVQFDDRYEKPYEFAPLASVSPLSEKTFVPRGSTALLDAIGQGIEETGAHLASLQESERPGKVLFVTLTDGMENASQRFNPQQIHAKISHQRDVYAWDFVFLAANQDAIATGAAMGFTADSSATFVATGKGQRFAMLAVSQATAKYRAADHDLLAFQRRKQSFFDAEDRAVIDEAVEE